MASDRSATTAAGRAAAPPPAGAPRLGRLELVVAVASFLVLTVAVGLVTVGLGVSWASRRRSRSAR